MKVNYGCDTGAWPELPADHGIHMTPCLRRKLALLSSRLMANIHKQQGPK